MRENRLAVRQRVGRNIKIHRRARRLSQERLAEMVDIQRRARGGIQKRPAETGDTGGKYIGQIERAEVNVSLDFLTAIAAAFSVNVAELFGPVPHGAAGPRFHILSERDYQYVERGLRALKKAKYPGRWRE